MNPRQTPSHRNLPDISALEGHEPWMLLDASGRSGASHGFLAAGVRRSLTIADASSDAFDRIGAFVGAAEGRCFGWIGYDQLRGDGMLALPDQPSASVGLPVVHWIEPEGVLAFNLGSTPSIEWQRRPADGLAERMESVVLDAAEDEETWASEPVEMATSSLDRPEYLQAFDRVRNHILRGDIYELNLCRELCGALPGDWTAPAAFSRLVQRTSAPYSTWIDAGGKHILSASPECFLEKRGRRLVSRPIKGTAPRHARAEQDAMAAELLRTDPKERAENVMITDLVRNDLSRIAASTSVEVEELCGIHSFKNVHQMVSTIACDVREDVGFADILRATFPMGSMTGAPKIRAMEITAEVESVRRGLYSGTVGWADSDGQGDVGDFHLNVVIRTILADLESRKWSAHVGGAITALARPESEWDETRLKAEALLQVMGAAERSAPETMLHG